MEKWFLVYCRPKQDMRAEENLIRQGYSVFRPTINTIKRTSGCLNTFKSESLFPRYVFIKVNPEVKSIAPVLSTLGVANFVKFGDQYATAPERLIDQIKSNAAKQSRMETALHTIKTGDGIRVDGAGFDQVDAIYCNPCGTERAMILMNILGRESKMVVPMHCISKKHNHAG